jgi:UDP-glucose 4-epimerase
MVRILITGGNGNLSKIIKKHCSNEHEIISVSRNDFDISDYKEVEKFFSKNYVFDVLIHTAIVGGRRTKEENYDVVYNNLLMFENIIKFSHLFKLIINFDSGAIYDRETDIFNRKESDLLTVPKDYYGFSKYLIYKRSLSHDNVFNFRIFNIFHTNEEPDRFIKSCFNAKINNTSVKIFQDKYFDFMYEDDFIKIIKYYIDNYNSTNNLIKTFNLSYKQKYKLSDIANLILKNDNMIEITNPNLTTNYLGDSSELDKINVQLDGLEKSLEKYEILYHSVLFDNFKYTIKYGLKYVNIDITNVLLTKFVKQNILRIPTQYYINKYNLLNIPYEFESFVKNFYITDKITNNTTEYANNQFVFIDLTNCNIYTENEIPDHIKEIYPNNNKYENFKLKINYGIFDSAINVNDIVINKFMRRNIIYIPSNDINRASFFGDPLPNILKYIIVYDENYTFNSFHDENSHVYINTDTNQTISYDKSVQDSSVVPNYIKEIFPEHFS